MFGIFKKDPRSPTSAAYLHAGAERYIEEPFSFKIGLGQKEISIDGNIVWRDYFFPTFTNCVIEEHKNAINKEIYRCNSIQEFKEKVSLNKATEAVSLALGINQ